MGTWWVSQMHAGTAPALLARMARSLGMAPPTGRQGLSRAAVTWGQEPDLSQGTLWPRT